MKFYNVHSNWPRRDRSDDTSGQCEGYYATPGLSVFFFRSDHGKTLDEMFTDACDYLDLLCRRENLKDVFKEKIQLYPPDIEKKFTTDEKTR